MKMIRPLLRGFLSTLVAGAAVLLSACAGGGGGTATSQPVVAIAAPQNGASFAVGERVAVQSASADANGITRVELYADGQLVQTTNVPSPASTQQFSVVQEWTATNPGAHALIVRSFNLAGLSGERSVAINVTGGAAQNPTVGQNPTVTPIATVISQVTATQPAASTAQPPATTAPNPITTTCVADSKFVSDKTIPDGSVVQPGQAFVKTWVLLNSGTCAWGPGFMLAYVSGEPMAAVNQVALPLVNPGETVEVSVNMQAPTVPGQYRGNWRPRTAEGHLFGTTISVVINVPAPNPPTAAPTATAVPVAFSPFFRGGDNVSVDTQGSEVSIEGSFTVSDNSKIDHVDISVFDGNGNFLVLHRENTEPYCYQGDTDNTCNYFNLGANGLRWHNGARAREGLNFARAVAFATNGTVRFAEQPFWLDFSGNNPQPNIFMDIVQTQPGDTGDPIRDALVFEVSVDNESSLKVDRVDLYVIANDGTVLQKIQQNSAPYCAFNDQNNVCNVYNFHDHNNLWPNGARISRTEILLRAVAYSGDRPVAGLTRSIELEAP